MIKWSLLNSFATVNATTVEQFDDDRHSHMHSHMHSHRHWIKHVINDYFTRCLYFRSIDILIIAHCVNQNILTSYLRKKDGRSILIRSFCLPIKDNNNIISESMKFIIDLENPTINYKMMFKRDDKKFFFRNRC